jgi:hypothetical protein
MKVKRKAVITVIIIIIAIITATCLVVYLSKKWCNVHHMPLIPDIVEIRYGLILYPEDYREARRPRFPNANTYVLGGCVVLPDSKRTAITFYCPKCRKAAQDWKNKK